MHHHMSPLDIGVTVFVGLQFLVALLLMVSNW